jgi:hypothetical protein
MSDASNARRWVTVITVATFTIVVAFVVWIIALVATGRHETQTDRAILRQIACLLEVNPEDRNTAHRMRCAALTEP